jgi:arginine-tRNA-protein transferase
MPGILSREAVLDSVDHVKLRVRNVVVETSDLQLWAGESIDNSRSLKGAIADLVAAVGTDIAERMCLTFS